MRIRCEGSQEAILCCILCIRRRVIERRLTCDVAVSSRILNDAIQAIELVLLLLAFPFADDIRRGDEVAKVLFLPWRGWLVEVVEGGERGGRAGVEAFVLHCCLQASFYLTLDLHAVGDEFDLREGGLLASLNHASKSLGRWI